VLTHLPILQVIVPLLAAPSCMIIQRPILVWLFTLTVSGLSFLISLALLQQVMISGAISYELGGWAPPWGIEYRVDELSAVLLLIITFVSTVVLVATHASISKEIAEGRQSLFYVLYLLFLAGILGIVSTGDVFNVFVFLEISSLSAYALIAMGSGRRALWASYQYLILGTIGATFILISIGLMYQMTGTLNMVDLAQRLPEVAATRTIFAAFAFFIVGVSLKLALFPLHVWMPNAYAYAPSVITAFFAATSTKVALYLLIRFTFTVFGFSYSFSTLPLQPLFLGLGLLAIFAGSATAIYQQNIKHLFVYSSVAQIGYLVVGYSMGTPEGLTATLLHVFNHALMKSALFLALAAVIYQVGSAQLKDFRGLGHQMPLTMAAIVVGGLSLIGVPLTVGFISKWYLVMAAIENGWWPVAILIVLGSLLAIAYVWRLVETAYFSDPTPEANPVSEAPLAFLLPLWVLAGANIYFGVDTRLSLHLAQAVSQSLFGVSP